MDGYIIQLPFRLQSRNVTAALHTGPGSSPSSALVRQLRLGGVCVQSAIGPVRGSATERACALLASASR